MARFERIAASSEDDLAMKPTVKKTRKRSKI